MVAIDSAGRQTVLNVIGKQFRDSIPLPSQTTKPNQSRVDVVWSARRVRSHPYARQATMDQLGTIFQIFIVGCCCLHRKNAKLQGLVPHRDGLATSQVFQSGASVEEMRVAKGGECRKGKGGVWCPAGGPRNGIAPLIDFVYAGMRVSV